MRLPSNVTSSKVKAQFLTAATVTALLTVLVNILSDSPLGDTWWSNALERPETIGALITIVSGLAGRQTEETAFDPLIERIQNENEAITSVGTIPSTEETE